MHKILEIGAIPYGLKPCLFCWPPHGQKLRRGVGDIVFIFPVRPAPEAGRLAVRNTQNGGDKIDVLGMGVTKPLGGFILIVCTV